MKWAIVIRKTAQSQNEILEEGILSEHRALDRANMAYMNGLLDSVIVLEIDKDNVHSVYKRVRRCKHPNIQFIISNSGEALPTCEACKLVIKPIEVEVFNEEG